MTEAEIESKRVLERALMFNDAVFAIALTLLVLELRLPDNISTISNIEIWHSLKAMTPKFLAFLLSAILVGGNWISLVNLQRMLVRADSGFIVDLVIYLTIISVIPFCCHFIGSCPNSVFPYVLFGVTQELLLINAFLFMKHCRRKKLYHDKADLKEIIKLEKNVVYVFFFVIIIVVSAFWSTQFSFILFLLSNLIPYFITSTLKINH